MRMRFGLIELASRASFSPPVPPSSPYASVLARVLGIGHRGQRPHRVVDVAQMLLALEARERLKLVDSHARPRTRTITSECLLPLLGLLPRTAAALVKALEGGGDGALHRAAQRRRASVRQTPVEIGVAEVAAITGQSRDMVEHYARAVTA
jgi:hypothetical protein